jgi:hypothetical protein
MGMSAPTPLAALFRRLAVFLLLPLFAACKAEAGAESSGAAQPAAVPVAASESSSSTASDGADGSASEAPSGSAGESAPAGEDTAGFIPAEEAAWREVKRWRGDGSRTTEKVRVRGGEFRVIYTATRMDNQYASLFVRVVNAEGRGVANANLRSERTDTTYVHEPTGLYHLEVSGSASVWTVSVEERALQAERTP